VARTLAALEPRDRERYEQEFVHVLESLHFLPADAYSPAQVEAE
jgi:hypothetical protein